MSDVPANSPRTAAHNFFVRLYRYPDRKAPIIEPGKARSEPEPMIFLITDVVKAAEIPVPRAAENRKKDIDHVLERESTGHSQRKGKDR